MNRKTFISQFMRLFLLGGMLVLTGFLVTRRKLIHQENCAAGSICSNCPDLKSCAREEAIKHKENG